ncbi:MAG: AAA family ATPase [Campylobacterota bacterium]|nr:AAA family ATPase [Campylobacterota bacterium]
MEKRQSVSQGLLVSGIIDQKMYENSLFDLQKSLDNLQQYRGLISTEDLETLQNIQHHFVELLPKRGTLDMSRGNVSICFEHGEVKHFSSITINQYKIFKNFTIDKLKRINIFAGFNNSGKSSLLESVYFLTKQNDIVSFLEAIKLRNKLSSLDPVWLNEVFAQGDVIDIKGTFNGVETSINFHKYEASNIDKKDDYLASYNLKATINDRKLDNTIHTFRFDTLKRENERVEHLCNSILKSPYFYNLKEVIETYSKNTIYKNSESKTAIRLVIEFIKSEIDPNIEDMRLYDVEDIERFIVDSTQFKDKNLEITNYGEGLQRIFEIALAFAYARNGVVCIDEFETAIHYSLLVDFTKFIQELAHEFNVQVFITSHSKECIDAFVENGYGNNEISAYFLKYKEDELKAIHTTGDKLKIYVDDMNFDLRGNRNG